ncbi:hypothetical protein [uncultured Zhongshania sp.]|uniref:hypothetical protein n=1 Tax=uncultured Zhongshania sp. TaxID=1642288 RepID=UPI0030DC36E6|tara:strand:- start:3368 stop:3814 length:447 start_codon:yes stop_codon:yes gene_type:complete
MKKLLILSLVALSGCTTLSKDYVLVTEGNDTSQLLVYRESSYQAGAVSLYVGEGDKYFLKLRNDQYSVIEINSGNHILQAKADASPASILEITLPPGETKCVASKPNQEMLGAVMIPIIANMVPSFLLEEKACPTPEILAGMENVSGT